MLQRVASLIRMLPPLTINRGLLSASGATKPVNGTDGFQTGCIFQHTDGTADTALYINEGSVTSCNFNAVIGSVDYGSFSSITAGSGIQITSSVTSVHSIFSDDGGANVGSSVRGVRSRTLLTVDQSAGTIRSLQGQLKLVDLIDVATGVYTSLQGYLELAGTHITSSGATLSCIDASLEITTLLTTASGGTACGIRVETTGAGTITNNGRCAGIVIEAASGAADWPVGILMTGLDVIVGLQIGAQANVKDSGVVLASGRTGALKVYTDDSGSSVATSSRGILSRTLLTVDQAGGTIRALQGQLKALNLVDVGTGVYTALQGYVELAGTHIANSTGTLSCIDASLEITTSLTIASGGFACGIRVETTGAGTITNNGTCAGILVQKVSGAAAWPVGLLIDTAASTTGISIGTCTSGITIDSNTTGISIGSTNTGITFTSTMNAGLSFSSATFSPNTIRNNQAIEIGGRGADELTITFAGGAGAEHFEPIQMNFDFAGTDPASTSTVNIWQGAITLDTNDLAAVRLKWSDLLTTVAKDVTDVYIHQAEIVFSGVTTASGEVAVAGLVLDAGAGTITNSTWRGLNVTLRGSATPAASQNIFLNVDSGATVDTGVQIQAAGTMTNAIRIGTAAYADTPTNLFAFPAAATAPIEAGSYATHAGTIVRISVLVGGAQYYMLASTAPST